MAAVVAQFIFALPPARYSRRAAGCILTVVKRVFRFVLLVALGVRQLVLLPFCTFAFNSCRYVAVVPVVLLEPSLKHAIGVHACRYCPMPAQNSVVERINQHVHIARKLLSDFCGQAIPDHIAIDSANCRKVQNIPAIERILRRGLSDASRYMFFRRFDYGLIPFAHLPSSCRISRRLGVCLAFVFGAVYPVHFTACLPLS